jgi:hypothetical protein
MDLGDIMSNPFLDTADYGEKTRQQFISWIQGLDNNSLYSMSKNYEKTKEQLENNRNENLQKYDERIDYLQWCVNAIYVEFKKRTGR